MTRTSLTVLVLLAGSVTGGCREKYRNQSLGLSGPEAAAVQAMLDALRKPGADPSAVIAGQQAAGLSEQQSAPLRAAGKEIAQAGGVRLVRLDRYGDEVVQAILELEPPSGRAGSASPGTASPPPPPKRLALLVTRTPAGYRWLGRP